MENPLSGGPSAYWKLSSTMAFNPPELPEGCSPPELSSLNDVITSWFVFLASFLHHKKNNSNRHSDLFESSRYLAIQH